MGWQLDSLRGGGSEPTLIEFSISVLGASYKYQAEDGMTWYEWCNSEYNTGELMCNSNESKVGAGVYVIKYDYVTVYGSDIIIANRTYYAGSDGGSN